MKKSTIKEYINLLVEEVLSEDIGIDKLHPKLIGLYSFIQAMNKSAHLSPVPAPTIDIIPDYHIRQNPGHLFFSKNSFKIRINPNSPNIDFSEGGHDIIHALTTNIAKHFARLRLKKSGENSFNIQRIPQFVTSKANIQRAHLTAAEQRTIKAQVSKFGITDFSDTGLQDFIRQKKELLKTLEPEDKLAKIVSLARKFKSQGIEEDEAYEKAREELFATSEIAKTQDAIDAARAIWSKLYDYGAEKSHFASARSFKTRNLRGGPIHNLTGVRHKGAIQKYGPDNTEFETGQMYLPQYEIEEVFGNILLGSPSTNSFWVPIAQSQPLSPDILQGRVDLFRKEVEDEFSGESIESFIERYFKYLETVISNYNQLLERYKSAKGLK